MYLILALSTYFEVVRKKVVGSNPGWSMIFFSSFCLRFSSRRPLVAKMYPIGVVKRFYTLRLGLKPVIFEFWLLSTTEKVYLSWKNYLALVLIIPSS